MPRPRPLSAAEKQRRYRERQRTGVQVVRVDVDEALIARLIEAQKISEVDARDPEKVAAVILELALAHV
jgi:hypothetical protein